MDLDLTDAQRLIRDSVREFVERELLPIAGDLDRLGQFPAKPLRRLAELGILGTTGEPRSSPAPSAMREWR